MSTVNRTEFPAQPSSTMAMCSDETPTESVSSSGPPTLLQRRLYENHAIPLSDLIMVGDCDCDDAREEKKEETDCRESNHTREKVVGIKTLVWEVQAVAEEYNEGMSTKSTRHFHVVTALQMQDKIEMRKLKDLVLEKTTQQGVLTTIRSMQLAPLEVAEGITGYRSGCMPPICHTDGTMDLYVDRSILDTYQSRILTGESKISEKNSYATKVFASIGSGVPGKSLVLPLQQFLRVAGVFLEEAITNNTVVKNARVKNRRGAGFVGSITSVSSPDARKIARKEAVKQPTSDEIKMMSGNEIRKMKQQERKEQREAKKDRLKEYRSFKKDDILNKAKLFRTTARKKGRISQMEELIQEALACGDFPKLMEIPDEQNPQTNIDKNALHICAWRGDFETVVRLIEISNKHYPHLDVVNIISKGPGNYGKTPIFYALTQCREDVVRYLAQVAGADLLIVNNKGQTPCSIAPSHMTEETCKLLYEIEARQLAARSLDGKQRDELFANYRASIHSDHNLYGDLDPRFPIDESNRFFNEKTRKIEEEKILRRSTCKNSKYDPKVFLDTYMDRADDLTDQIKEYEESVKLAPDESKIHGIPTEFSPRSLRPTVRWWNRDDRSLAKANDDASSGDQITFTQPRPSSRRAHRSSTGDIRNEEDQSIEDDSSRFRNIDIESLEKISIDDIFGAHSSSDLEKVRTESNKTLVDNTQTLRLFEEEVDNWIFELNRDREIGDMNDEMILLRYAWGLDCEWKPGPDCGEDSPVSTLQLGTVRKAFLIDLQTLCRVQKNLEEDDFLESELNRILLKIFRNPNIPLVGYGVLQDLGKLAGSFPHLSCFSEFVSVVDLQSISSVIYNTKFDQKAMSSLQKMTAMLLEKRLDKVQQVSDWSHRPLSDEQISYAMLDAAIIPLLLGAMFENNTIIEGYNGRFFHVHKNLLSTVRYLPIEPCEDGYAYEIAYGSIKTTLGKAFARQSWPTKMNMEPPEPPKLVQIQQILESDFPKQPITKKERAHLRKLGADAAGNIPKRPKPIPLKSLAANLSNLPKLGITLGYTKESCAFRVVGHQLFKTIPEGTYIGFNRRAGVVETSNAWILFCNFGGNKVFSEFFDHGQKLSFRVNSASQAGRSSEASLFRQIVSSPSRDTKQILLFARESTRKKFLYCGFCTCTNVEILDANAAALVLRLENYQELVCEKLRASSDFIDLVAASKSRGNLPV